MPDDCLDGYDDHELLQQLLHDNSDLGTLGDMCAQSTTDYATVINFTKVSLSEVQNRIWTFNSIFTFLGATEDFCLDHDQVFYLAKCYKAMYNIVAALPSVSFRTTKYTQVKLGNTTLGSQISHSKRSSYIQAAWIGMNGEISESETKLRPAKVMYNIKHCFEVNGSLKTHLFAFVQWYQYVQEIVPGVEAWSAKLYEPFGPASFLPVQRIHSQYVAAFNKYNDEEVLFMCPLQQKVFV